VHRDILLLDLRKESPIADDLVDQLLAQTGLHVGTDRDPTSDQRAPQVARIMVTALPGGCGVMCDYEGLSLNAERPRPHSEHAVIGRTSSGLALYTANIHAPVLMELRETEPGYFEAVEGSSPFPMAIRIEVPSSRRLIYSWLFGERDGEVTVRNVGDVTLLD
jgi:hypothetical protein